MDVAIAGGHGKIGLQLGRLLAGRGDRVRGLVRNPEQADDLVAGGIEPVLCDLEGEHDVAAAVRGGPGGERSPLRHGQRDGRRRPAGRGR